METTKQDFSRFVSERRRGAGLTQRELATRLHVTESAVSKWERGLSYPDITMVELLAGELGVSLAELISASEDREGREEKREARSYRRWRASWFYSTAGLYALALITCFIVNLSVNHTLSWFWIVLPAVTLAFSLTTLPLLPLPHRGWFALGGALVSLALLLGVVWLTTTPGPWFAITVASVLFGLVVIFAPIVLAQAKLANSLGRHRTVLALAIDTVALIAMLFVIFAALGMLKQFVHPTLALTAVVLVPIWAIVMLLRYSPLRGFGLAAIIVALSGAVLYFAQAVVARVLEGIAETEVSTLNLAVWSEGTIEANIRFLVLSGAIALAIVFSIIAMVRGSRR